MTGADPNTVRVVALSGGVGGAKLALGLQHALSPGELMVIANTGDDFTHLGLQISPDIDTLLYTLSGRASPDLGWGRAGETWSFMEALQELGGPQWFRLGDKDLAVNVLRTERLSNGTSLAEVTRELATRFEVPSVVLPMSNQPVRTKVRTHQGWLEFQQYFVREQCRPAVRELSYSGALVARPLQELVDVLRDADLRAVVICPSNPHLSIDPILAVNGMRAALGRARAPIIAVSPIVAGRALKGPTAKIMNDLGLEVNAISVALHYCGVIDGLVIDEADGLDAAAIESLGVRVSVAGTLMTTFDTRLALARQVLQFADELRSAKNDDRGRRDTEEAGDVGAAAG